MSQPGSASVVGAPAELQPPAPVGPDSVADADGGTEIRQRLTLLDVQLDIGTDPRQQLLIRPDATGVAALAAVLADLAGS